MLALRNAETDLAQDDVFVERKRHVIEYNGRGLSVLHLEPYDLRGLRPAVRYFPGCHRNADGLKRTRG